MIVIGLALSLFVLLVIWARLMYLRAKVAAFIRVLKIKGYYGAKFDKAMSEFWAAWPREPVAWYVKRAGRK